jgi:hypothetical protein
VPPTPNTIPDIVSPGVMPYATKLKPPPPPPPAPPKDKLLLPPPPPPPATRDTVIKFIPHGAVTLYVPALEKDTVCALVILGTDVIALAVTVDVIDEAPDGIRTDPLVII